MQKTNTIDKVLAEQNFTEDEKKAFKDMISYAKFCQKGMEDNLKLLIDQKLKGLLGKWNL